MNRIRNAILEKMTSDNLDFIPDTVHVVTLDFGSGILQENPLDFTDVLLTVDVTYQSLAGAQVHSVVRIPVEGWSEPWTEIQRGILDAVNAGMNTPTNNLRLTDSITVV